MLIDGPPLRLTERLSGQRKTHLGMLIDPPKQSPDIAHARAIEFARQGGGAVLIGGSGFIDNGAFQQTVKAVVEAPVEIPIVIFPGHINQIPQSPDRIAGVLNYSFIVG
jgi:heptaprenylglyceryl phosphate synthase